VFKKDKSENSAENGFTTKGRNLKARMIHQVEMGTKTVVFESNGPSG
jgi:hypothetical protein